MIGPVPPSPRLELWLLIIETEPGDRQSLALVLIPFKYFFCFARVCDVYDVDMEALSITYAYDPSESN